jgi:hypothetical protein
VTLECVACCLRWLAPLTAEGLRLNAPVIGIVAGTEQLQAVRKAYSAAGMRPVSDERP